MIHKRDTSTLLKKLGADTRLAIALACILSVCCIQNYWLSLAIMIASYILIFEEKMTGLFKFLAVGTVMLFLMQYTLYGTIVEDNVKNGGILFYVFDKYPYYTAGFHKAIHFSFRIAPLMASLFLIFKTFEMTDLGILMCKAGLPYRYAFIFIDCFMCIAILTKDMDQIMDAQKSRGLVTEGNLMTRMKAFIPVIVPVVANSISKVQDQAIAMDTKGFNSKCKKSIYREIPCTKVDKVLKAVSLTVSVLSVVFAILVATGVIPKDVANIIQNAAYDVNDFIF